jgi:predicted permease
MRDGVRLDALRSELQSLVETAPAEYGDHRGIARRVEEGRVQAAPVSLQDHMTGKVRATLWMLLGAVALVLLTAWANVANLFLVRTDARRREVAVRRALGAGRGAIARFHFAEGGILALAGWLFGLALAWVAIRSIIGLSSLDLPRADEITIDANVLIVSFILAVLAGAGLTAIPLWGGERAAAGALGDGGRGSTASRARLRFRSFLMAGQVALALMLLAGSGLLVRSYLRVRDASPGFTARNVLFFDVGLTASGYGTKAAAAQFHDRLADRIGALPGVERVGIATCLPFDGYCWGEGITIDGESRSEENSPNVSMRRVSPGFFETLQLPMVAGRAFTAEDARARADVVVLSEATARRFFGNADPIGRRVTIGDGGLQWYTIVGVATDAASHSVMEAARELVFYLPIRDSRDDPRTVSIHGMRFLVRTSGAPEELAPAVRAIVGELDPGLALDRVRTLDSILAADRAPVAFTAGLLLIAGGVALLLGALGIHAVVSYVVGRRTAEIGLRLALGARAGHVLGMVFRQAGAATLAGVVIGLAGAALLTRLLTSQLFGVEPLDPAVFAAATGLLLVAAFSAAAIPARRASRLRPLDALRVE